MGDRVLTSMGYGKQLVDKGNEIGKLKFELQEIEQNIEVEQEHASPGNIDEVIETDAEVLRLKGQRLVQESRYASKIQQQMEIIAAAQRKLDVLTVERDNKFSETDKCIENRIRKIREPVITKRMRKLFKQRDQVKASLQRRIEEERLLREESDAHDKASQSMPTPSRITPPPQNTIVQTAPPAPVKKIKVKSPPGSLPRSPPGEVEEDHGKAYCSYGDHHCSSICPLCKACAYHKNVIKSETVEHEGKTYYRWTNYLFTKLPDGNVGKECGSISDDGEIDLD